jgi:hypothetical protein
VKLEKVGHRLWGTISVTSDGAPSTGLPKMYLACITWQAEFNTSRHIYLLSPQRRVHYVYRVAVTKYTKAYLWSNQGTFTMWLPSNHRPVHQVCKGMLTNITKQPQTCTPSVQRHAYQHYKAAVTKSKISWFPINVIISPGRFYEGLSTNSAKAHQMGFIHWLMLRNKKKSFLGSLDRFGPDT